MKSQALAQIFTLVLFLVATPNGLDYLIEEAGGTK